MKTILAKPKPSFKHDTTHPFPGAAPPFKKGNTAAKGKKATATPSTKKK